jgi:hypothetical protein
MDYNGYIITLDVTTFRAYVAKSPIDIGVRCGGSILAFPNISLFGYIRFTQKTNANAPIYSSSSLERFRYVRLLRQFRFAQ